MMSRVREMCAAFHADEEAVVATEYLLLLILIACVGMAVVIQLGRTSQRKFQRTGTVVGRNQDFGIID